MKTSRQANRWVLSAPRPELRVVLTVTILLGVTHVAMGQRGVGGHGGAESDSLPLAPTRVVRFQATEGTWMSLDVSPDGRTIVFDLLGDLYTIPIEGGTARRLTTGMAFNRQPRYSPDGQHLVFVSDRSGSANVWIADRDGRGGRQLSHLQGYGHMAVTSPAWSPDGHTIVVSQNLGATRPGLVGFTRIARWLLAAYDVETAQMRWISDTTADQSRSALGPIFNPTGRTVYAAVDAFPNPNDWWSDAEWRVARIDLASGRAEPEVGSRFGRAGMRPAVSPDGRYLVYVSSSGSHLGFRLRDLYTDRERWLAREMLDDPAVSPQLDSRDLMPGYAFTPDSRSLIAGYGGKIHRIDVVTGNAAVIPFVADVERSLGPLRIHQFELPDGPSRTSSIMQPALSPDGRLVAFSAVDRIWIMQLPPDGRDPEPPRRLTNDSVGEFYPSWSPDGRWIAYSTWLDGEGGAVRRASVRFDADAAPSPSERLTSDTAVYFDTAIAQDGERIVTVRASLPPERVLTPRWDGPLDPRLVWVPVKGGLPRTVASLTAEQHAWRHAQGGYPVDQVYFTADPERLHVGLTSWRWDGMDRQMTLTVSGLEDSYQPYSVVGVLSPDGRRALVTRRFTLFELRLRSPPGNNADSLDLAQAQKAPFRNRSGAAQRWGPAILPWISWSADGRRVLFSQGGTLFVGDVRPDGWTSFARVDVPLQLPVYAPRGTLVLHGARLITMRGREVIDRGDIVVHDNRIVAVGAQGKVPLPVAACVLDLSGATILPGYVDLHDHIWLPRNVHPQQCWECLARLAYGVTTVRDPQSFVADVFTYHDRERTGDLIGPRLFSTGPGYFGSDPPIQSLEDAREVVRPYAEYFGSETFKNYFYGPSSSRRAWQLLVMATADAGLNPTVHGQGLETQLTMAIDGYSGLEHTPAIQIYADVATLIARSGVTHTQTYGRALFGSWHYMLRRYGGLWDTPKMRRFAPPSARAFPCDWCASYPYGPPEFDALKPVVSGAARIAAKGGRVGMGSHGDIPGLGPHYELWFYALGGMPNHEILRSATIVGATAIGHSNDFGSLEPGKLADLQVLERNPLKNIHNTLSLRYVMKNGLLYAADDLTEIWPRYQPLASPYLWEPTSSPRVTGIVGRGCPGSPALAK